jgi:hypothetical protein
MRSRCPGGRSRRGSLRSRPRCSPRGRRSLSRSSVSWASAGGIAGADSGSAILSTIFCDCCSGDPKILCHKLTPAPFGAGGSSARAAGGATRSRGGASSASTSFRRRAGSDGRGGLGGAGRCCGALAAGGLAASRSGRRGGSEGSGAGGTSIPKFSAKLSQSPGVGFGKGGAARFSRGSRRGAAGFGDSCCSAGGAGVAPNSRTSSSQLDEFSGLSMFTSRPILVRAAWFSAVALANL